ncbi:hypothetical protein GW17_00041079 [Ensete ventricosum]|nr:hypothetical protein GW17_00041079 [Ensete ventricosum]RZS03729.1 hypothetical protein BHM03_00033941 [Ensete ventricosum]
MKIDDFLKHQPVTILVDTRSTNDFMDSKVASRLMLRIEDCSRFHVKVADCRILNCSRKCPRVKLVLQGQEITADLFLLALDNYEAVLRLNGCPLQIHSPDTRLDEEAQFQLEIARHRKIMTHHYLDTTIDEEIQDKARPWDRDAPTMDATRKPHDKLQTRTRRS